MYSVVLVAPVGHWKGNSGTVSTQALGDGWRMEGTAGQVDISLELDGHTKPHGPLALYSIWPLQSPTKWETWFALEFSGETGREGGNGPGTQHAETDVNLDSKLISGITGFALGPHHKWTSCHSIQIEDFSGGGDLWWRCLEQ